MIRTTRISTKEPILKEGEKIFLYKKFSNGEVVGIYDSIKDIVNREQIINKKFCREHISSALSGRTKSFVSFYHSCRVRPVIKKIA